MAGGRQCSWVAMVLVLAALASLGAAPAWGTVYYVDPAGGDDLNQGISAEAPWQHLPGSYRQDNSGFISAPGWKKLVAGDEVRVRSGSVLSNRVVISSVWYGNGSSENPILLTRDPAWGTGPVVLDGTGVALGSYDALMLVNIDGFRLEGVQEGGFVIRDSASYGFQAMGDSENTPLTGLRVSNLKLFNNLRYNFVLQSCDSFLVERVEIDGNGADTDSSGGFHVGGARYGCSNGRFNYCSSYRNGNVPGSQAGGSSARIGFWTTNSTGITYYRCVAHDNEGDGFDTGVVTPVSVVTDRILYLDCESYNNADGFAANLDDVAGASRVDFFNCISRGNSVGFNIYEGPTARVMNCLAAYNRAGLQISALSYASRDTVVTLKNTILYRNNDGDNSADIFITRDDDLVFVSDYNHFGEGGQTRCIRYDAVGTDLSYYYGRNDAPGSLERRWYTEQKQDPNSTCSDDLEFALFVDEVSFRPQSESATVRAGVYIPAVPELLFDVEGRARPEGLSWDMGPYYLSDLVRPGKPLQLEILEVN